VKLYNCRNIHLGCTYTNRGSFFTNHDFVTTSHTIRSHSRHISGIPSGISIFPSLGVIRLLGILQEPLEEGRVG
jgi:hypothetical protein